MWWHILIVPGLGRQRQDHQVLKEPKLLLLLLSYSCLSVCLSVPLACPFFFPALPRFYNKLLHFIKTTAQSQVNNLMLSSKALERLEQTNPQSRRCRERMKTRAEMSGMGMEKQERHRQFDSLKTFL